MAPEVAGSKPVAHPILPPSSQDEGVFVLLPINSPYTLFCADATMGIMMSVVRVSREAGFDHCDVYDALAVV